MKLQAVGAGLPRTGTHSLKLALEQLLGQPCYHLLEIFDRPQDVTQWQQAVHGQTPDWDRIFGGYAAAVDFPAAAFYAELMDLNPDAIVLLSTREDPEVWWRSMNATVIPAISRVEEQPPPLEAMAFELLDARFTPDWRDPDAAMEAYRRHNAEVRSRVRAPRLVEWQPGDGWGPICKALDLREPVDPFPHVNTTTEFRLRTGLDQPLGSVTSDISA